MAQEMICGRCGRRETVDSGETAAICPACGGTLLWAAPEGPTISWMPLTEELPLSEIDPLDAIEPCWPGM